MKIVNIWKFLEFMSMANALPLGYRKLVNPPPYPGGTLGDSLDTSITVCLKELRNVEFGCGYGCTSRVGREYIIGFTKIPKFQKFQDFFLFCRTKPYG